ncbi:MAG TPA: matrixin family metalloprotease [Bryobacteraceae bacterium]|nr:matrixin family metalloprotease [Bryobacteraceae bacterium]
MAKSIALLILLPLVSLAQPSNWQGLYAPCLNSAELKKSWHMSIGIKYEICDQVVGQQFRRAFDFWAKVLDADFHEEQSTSCAIAIVDATDAVLLHNRAIVARAQLPDRLNFQGLIAVDPKASTYLADDEAIAIWIHEIGLLFGLKHNSSPASVMYWLDVDASRKLDPKDLHTITSLHAVRPVRIGAIPTEALP